MEGVLVRFGEIGIKSQPVRRMMQNRLRDNLLAMMLREGVEGDVQNRGARIWMVGPAPARLLDVAKRTFGVVSASVCTTCEATMQEMGQVASMTALQKEWQSFAVRARRQGKHDFSSQDIGVQVGSAVHQAATAAGRDPRVDLDEPELELHVEVRDRTAYIFTEQAPGAGGLPLGSQGTVAALMSDTASAIAAWLMMRRGCDVVPVHAGDMGSAPVSLLHPLQQWGLGDDVELLPVCKRVTTKHALLEAASAVAKDHRAAALVTGEGLGSHPVAAPMPVLRPVMGLAPAAVRDLQRRIGLPDEAGPGLLVDEGGDTAEELLRMRRTVSA